MMESAGVDSDYFRLFTSRNAKLLSIGFIVVVTIYHSLLKLKYGEDLCVGLLETGRYQGDYIWQPYGCMLHSYSRSDSRMCMKYNHYWGRSNAITFVGDSRIYQLFTSFSQQLNPSQAGAIPPRLSLDFGHHYPVYDRYVESELNLTVEYYSHLKIDHSVATRFQEFSLAKQRPGIIVVGAAAASILDGNDTAEDVKDYAANISHLLPYIQQVKGSTRVLWVVQAPVIESKLRANFSLITNEVIDQYNTAAKEILAYTAVKIWESARLLSLYGDKQDSPDGFHLGPVALNYKTQILFNLYCNDLMNYADGTCCSHDEPVTILQIVSFAVLSFSIIFGFCLGFSRCRRRLRNKIHKMGIETNSVGLHQTSLLGLNGTHHSSAGGCDYDACLCWMKLCGLLLFAFIADRSGMYMKENKWFTYLNFFLPVAYLGVLGIFFTEETAKVGLMHRDQTEELRGWILLAILVHNMTGASKAISLYMVYQLLVSSLLFLTGFVHFTYFWTTGDFSLKRIFKVLFKYNFLTVLLCICMNRPYQFYEYVPLISYWFLVIYLMMAFPPQVTACSAEANSLHYFYVILKFVGLFGCVSILFLSEVFFENIFITRPWKALFVLSDDSIQAWWFRWWLHRYAMFDCVSRIGGRSREQSAGAGMLFAFITSILRRYLILNDSQSSNIFSRRLTIFAFLGCITGISTYCFMISRCKNQSESNEVHAYLSSLPIVSFLLLRNLFGCIRVRFSTFFAWFGRLWIELLVVQCHVWLAADSAGVLVLFPRWPVFNVILTSFIFVCIAHELRRVTLRLLAVAVPEEPQKIVRNAIVILIFCLPLGMIYGMI